MIDIIASVLGGLVGGLFTFIGVLMTIRYENKKARAEEVRRQKEKEEQLFENRPRLDIIGYNGVSKYVDDKQADLSVLFCFIKDYKRGGRFYYDSNALNPEKWVSVESTLKNVGHTEINHMYVSTDLPKITAVFGVENGEYKTYCTNNVLNYSVILDKPIRPMESIKFRVCYLSEEIVVSNRGRATMTIWMVDEKKNWWAQPLFAPDRKIYDSAKASHKEWRNYTDEQQAIKCFEDPMLW